jgi:hypothetical protein
VLAGVPQRVVGEVAVLRDLAIGPHDHVYAEFFAARPVSYRPCCVTVSWTTNSFTVRPRRFCPGNAGHSIEKIATVRPRWSQGAPPTMKLDVDALVGITPGDTGPGAGAPTVDSLRPR